MNSGSVDSLDVRDRCSASANVRQIRETTDCDVPVAAVASPGGRTTTHPARQYSPLGIGVRQRRNLRTWMTHTEP